MTTTTSYGTWNNHGDKSELTLEATVLMAINGGDAKWRERMEESGALKRIASEYRNAIDDALPDGVNLCGDEFYGPASDEDCGWEGELDIKEIAQGVDLFAIIERYDVDNIEVSADLVKQLLASTAHDPVLYIDYDAENGAPIIEVGPEAHTSDRAIVIRRHDLLDTIGEDEHDAYIPDTLPDLQKRADEIAFG